MTVYSHSLLSHFLFTIKHKEKKKCPLGLACLNFHVKFYKSSHHLTRILNLLHFSCTMDSKNSIKTAVEFSLYRPRYLINQQGFCAMHSGTYGLEESRHLRFLLSSIMSLNKQLLFFQRLRNQMRQLSESIQR